MAINIDKIRKDLLKKKIKDIVIDIAIEMKLMNGKLQVTSELANSNRTVINRVFIAIGIGFATLIFGLGAFFIQRFVEGL